MSTPQKKRGPGRPEQYPEKLLLQLPAGTRERIDAVRGAQPTAEFIRTAIERELSRRKGRER